MSTRRKSRTVRVLESKVREPLTLGAFLEAIRLGEKLSQAEFARRLGISRSHLCDIEKGRKVVGAERAVRFASELGYSQAQFLQLSLQAMLAESGLKFSVTVRAA